MVGLGGFEPPTPRLSSVCSDQLSYRPGQGLHQPRNGADLFYWQVTCVDAPSYALKAYFKGGDPAAGSPTATLLRLHPSH
jgi:hypothetical protein